MPKGEMSPSDKFEDRVRQLLKDLGFTKVRGGGGFEIGGSQIDACGVCDGKMVVIEATTQKKGMRSKIESWKGKQSAIRGGLGTSGEYRKYNKSASLRFILASRYSGVDQYASVASAGPNKVFLWEPNTLQYYEKIARAIPFRAKYDVLADLGFEMEKPEAIQVPAFNLRFDSIDMYNFFISPDELIKVSYVARRETGRKDFYQRMVEPSRLSEITKFLNKGNLFPTNIVVGINGEYQFSRAKLESKEMGVFPDWLSFGTLIMPKSYQSCWIIDGQHRLFAFKPGMKQKLAVLAFGNIGFDKQTRFFVEVNKTAKPISSMLLWDLYGDLSPQSEEGIISNSAKIANKTQPLDGKISIPSVGRAEISIATFCSSLLKSDFGRSKINVGRRRLFVENPFFNKNHSSFSKNIANSIALYFKSIDGNIGDDKDYVRDFVFDNGGASVLIYLYKILICLEGGKKVDKRIASKYLIPIVDYLESQGKSVINEYKKKCSSEGGKKLVLNDLLKLLEDVNPDVADYIEEKTDLLDSLIDLESMFRQVVEVEFKRRGFSELKKHINKKVVEEVENSIKKRTADEVRDFCSSLRLGQAALVITRELWREVFRNVFVRPESSTTDMGDLRFPNDDLFKVNLNYAVIVRNKLAHNMGYSPTRKEKEQLESFVSTTKSLIARYYKI